MEKLHVTDTLLFDDLFILLNLQQFLTTFTCFLFWDCVLLHVTTVHVTCPAKKEKNNCCKLHARVLRVTPVQPTGSPLFLLREERTLVSEVTLCGSLSFENTRLLTF